MSSFQNNTKKEWRPATISDVAKGASVSKATVSLVLNNSPSPIKISEATRNRVMDVAKELDYSPNRLARAFSTRKSNVLGLIASSTFHIFESAYSARVMAGIVRAAHERNYNIMIFDDDVISKNPSSQYFVHLIASRYIDGLIVLGPDRHNPSMTKHASELQKKGMPFVFVWRRLSHVEGTTISLNNELGVQKAGQYLLSLGHKNIAIVTHGEKSKSSMERLKAFKKIMHKNGLAFPEELIWHNEFHPNDDHKIVDEILSLKTRPSAIFSFYDPIAINIINILRSKNISIPDDISVVGFGDVYPHSYTHPILTTIREPFEEIGQAAVSALLDQVEHADDVSPEQEITINPDLIVRNSCGPAKQGF